MDMTLTNFEGNFKVKMTFSLGNPHFLLQIWISRKILWTFDSSLERSAALNPLKHFSKMNTMCVLNKIQGGFKLDSRGVTFSYSYFNKLSRF